LTTFERPRLRPIRARRLEFGGQPFVSLEDPLGIAADPVLVPLDGYHGIVCHFDGRTTLAEIQARAHRLTGRLVPLTQIQGLIDRLDRALLLDGPRFAAYSDGYRTEAVRPPAFAGRSYAGTDHVLRAQLAQHFADPRGAGLPDGHAAASNGRRLRGILSPHIDYQRGGPTYTWAYRELIERSNASVFVILGVAHQYCRRRFALTRKDFATPLGTARTDRQFVDRLAEGAGSEVFDDELAHHAEHSIEFQVVFLQYLLGDRRDYTIVPILVGSFHDLMDAGLDPIESVDVERFVGALRAAESACDRSVVYIGGIDLCHVGPEFGDPQLLDSALLGQVEQFDAAMLDRAIDGDPAGWFRTAAAIDNRYRVCGLAATYTMLHALGPTRGRLLRYDQAVNPERTCGVTFASLALDQSDAP
jgi:AmmeMemoRadiSam system protein B